MRTIEAEPEAAGGGMEPVAGLSVAGLSAAAPERLGRLGKGASARIFGLDEGGAGAALPAGELERRLLEFGFVEGAAVEVLHEGLSRRDPIAVRVNGCTIALRRTEADAVLVAL